MTILEACDVIGSPPNRIGLWRWRTLPITRHSASTMFALADHVQGGVVACAGASRARNESIVGGVCLFRCCALNNCVSETQCLHCWLVFRQSHHLASRVGLAGPPGSCRPGAERRSSLAI